MEILFMLMFAAALIVCISAGKSILSALIFGLIIVYQGGKLLGFE